MKSRCLNLTINTLITIILYGQLGYDAITYYINVVHPSWPIWISLYLVAAALSIRYILKVKIAITDVYFIAFIGYIILNFVLLGESSQMEFGLRILIIIIMPYLCGRIVGKCVQLSLFRGLMVICFLYLIIIGVMLRGDLHVLTETDRLILFVNENAQGTGGSGDAFNIGITFGSAWLVAFTYLLISSRNITINDISNKPQLKAIVITFPLLLLLVGSRVSIFSMAVSAGMLLYIAPGRMHIKAWSALVFFAVGLLFFYNILPEQRKHLLAQIVSSMTSLMDISIYSTYFLENDSILARVVMFRDAFQQFLSSPIFGIGVSNFGLHYSGSKVEFASPHSTFLQVVAEGGLLGAYLFIQLIFSFIRNYYRIIRCRKYFMHSNVAIVFSLWLFVLLQDQFTGNIYIGYHFYLLSGLLVSCLRRHDLIVSVSSRQKYPEEIRFTCSPGTARSSAAQGSMSLN